MPKFGPKLTPQVSRRRLNLRINTDPVFVAVADGLFAVAMRIGEVAAAAAPDDPMYVDEAGQRVDQPTEGFGLPSNWGVIAWANGNVVKADNAAGTGKVTKPRGMGPTSKTGADAAIGFGFPGRFQELGTVNQSARPFLGPAALHVVTSAEFEQILAANFPKGPNT